MVKTRRFITAILLALVLVLSAAGCGGVTAGNQGTGKNGAPAQSETNEKQKIVDYLKAAKNDLTLIDEIMADKELGLLEEPDPESEEELTAELIEKYDGILKGYSARVKTTLESIGSRETPANPELRKFKTAETTVFETLDSILQEYIQTLSYAGTILDVTESLEGIENVYETDLQAIYNAISAGISEAIAKLEKANVPSFIESVNNDFIDALRQADDTVYYALSAVYIDDPLRIDAAEYLLEVFYRRVDRIVQGSVEDMGNRQKQLMEDSREVSKTADGLKRWLETNLTALGD